MVISFRVGDVALVLVVVAGAFVVEAFAEDTLVGGEIEGRDNLAPDLLDGDGISHEGTAP